MICRDTPTHGWVCGWMGGSVGQWVGSGQNPLTHPSTHTPTHGVGVGGVSLQIINLQTELNYLD